MRRTMPRFLLARDLGIDLGELTRPGMARLAEHVRKYPSTRHLLMLLLIVTVQANAKDAASADRALRAYLPGMYEGRDGSAGDCGHPGCAPGRCSVAEFEARRSESA